MPSQQELKEQNESPKNAENEVKGDIATIAEVFRYATSLDYLLMIIGFVGATTVGVCQPAMMWFFKEVVDNAGGASPGSDMVDTFNRIGRNIALLGLVAWIGGWMGDFGFKTAGERQSIAWRKAYLKAILRQDIGWFDTNSPSELSSQMAEVTQNLEDGVGSKLMSGTRFLFQTIGGFGIAFWQSWDMALVLIGLSPMVMFGMWFLQKTVSEEATETTNAYSKAGGVASETLSELRTVAALGAEDKQKERYVACLDEARRVAVRVALKLGFAQGAIGASGNFFAAAGFIYGCHKVSSQLRDSTVDLGGFKCDLSAWGWRGEECNCRSGASFAQEYTARGLNYEECTFSGGAIMMSLFSLQIGAQGLGLIEPAVTAFVKARRAARQMLKVINNPVTVDTFSEEGLQPDKVKGDIRFENVFFSYPSRPDQQVCQGYNLDIPAGQTVALVGQSGSGKSTAVQLIERFYDPDSGAVFLDGKDLREYNVNWLRTQIGLVSQEPVLFTGSIADNIANGKPGASREEIQSAAEMANAHHFILQFPDGYDTDVGEKGSQLSGGQKQRVAIARAIIKNPAVLLLDEATSALDTESERVVQAALDDLLLKQKRTTVVIAHRLSTIRNSDKIAVVSKGQVVEQGTHAELMALGAEGLYFKLNQAGDRGIEDDPEGGSFVEETEERSFDRRTSEPKQTEDAVVALSDQKQKSKEEIAAEKKEQGNKHKENVKRVWAIHSGDSNHLMIGSVGAICAGAAQPAVAIVMAKGVANFFENDPDYMMRRAYFWSAMIATVAVGQLVGNTFSFYGFAVPGANVTLKLRSMFYSALVRQEIGWHDLPDNTSGNLCAHLATEVKAISALTAQSMGTHINALSLLICALAFGFGFGGYWKLMLVGFACCPLFLIGIIADFMAFMGPTLEGSKFGTEAGRIVQEAVLSVRTVSSFTLNRKFDKDYRKFAAEKSGGIGAHLGRSFLTGYAAAGMFLTLALLYWYGGTLIGNGSTDFDGMFMPILVMIFLAIGLTQSLAIMEELPKASAAAARVFDVVDRESKIDFSADTGRKLDSVRGEIRFKDVYFTYPSRPDQPVCRGYNLTVEAGQTVALVGSSGSGKSTAVQLTERFYDPDEGTVTLDGVDLRELSVKWLREQIGFVGQEPVLFQGTIQQNISLGKQEASLDEVIKAAEMSNAHTFISEFPEKYDTLVGEKGGQLSGGQKQRIAIARAIIKNPSILLLDEATSALDTESERLVQAALDDLLLKLRRTTIVIAHRLTTIQNASKIAVVHKGQIVEEGTHSELLSIGKKGRYYGLWTTQADVPH